MQQLFVRACWNGHETWTPLEWRLWNKIVCKEQLCLRSSASVLLNCELLTENSFQPQERILSIPGSEELFKSLWVRKLLYLFQFPAKTNPPEFQELMVVVSLASDWSSQLTHCQRDNTSPCTYLKLKNPRLLTMQVKPPYVLSPLLQMTEYRSLLNVAFL